MAEMPHVDPLSTSQDKTHAASDIEETRYFDFFGLPRELRDRVYAELDRHFASALVGDAVDISSPDLDKMKKGRVLGMRFMAAPCTKMLLVSKQFAIEYQEEILRGEDIMIEFVRPSTRGGSVSLAHNPGIQRHTAQVRRMTINIARGLSHDSSDALAKYDHFHDAVVTGLSSYLPLLQKISVWLSFYMRRIDFSSTDRAFWKDTFEASLKKVRQTHGNLQIEDDPLFLGRLYSFWPSHQPTEAEICRVPEISKLGWESFCDWVWDNKGNRAAYTVGLSDKESSFHGLEFWNIEAWCESYDWERISNHFYQELAQAGM